MSNRTSTKPYANAGLPEAEDYNPEAIGAAELEAGDPVQVWEQYGLEMVPVRMDGDDTGRRIIRRNGNYIADVTERYKLLPNEEAVAAANDVARELGAEPFHEFDGDWFVQLDDHVFQDEERRRVHAVYAWESGSIGDDEMEYGFAIHNSIDQSMAFKVGLFSFRHACKNMVMMGADNWRDQFAQNVEDEREVLAHDSHKHTHGLEVDRENLKARIESTVGLIRSIDETYSAWDDRPLKPQEVWNAIERLPAKTLPEWMQDAAESLADAQENEDLAGNRELTPERRAEIVQAHRPEAETAWETYNSLTENIWHNDSSGDTTKQDKFRKLHASMVDA